MKAYDTIIIGGGPAGITAAVYCVRKNLDILLLTEDIGGQALWSGDIENYTGFKFLTGPQLADKFYEHMSAYGISPQIYEKAEKIEKSENRFFKVHTAKAIYEAKTVIIASGKSSKKLGVKGEEELRNKGVAYCATCDGPLFKNKQVSVIGGGNSALDAALSLMKICTQVNVINNTKELGGDAVMRQKVLSAPNVTVYNSATVEEIIGSDFVQSIKITTDQGEKHISTSAVFVEIGLVPNANFLTIAEKNIQGEIKVDTYNRTSVEGLFAAGDVTDVPEKQIIIACGEGAKSALSAFNYIVKNF